MRECWLAYKERGFNPFLVLAPSLFGFGQKRFISTTTILLLCVVVSYFLSPQTIVVICGGAHYHRVVTIYI